MADARWSAALADAAKAHRIQAFWTANPMMLNVRLPDLPAGVHGVATIHDLIPLQMPERYLDRWPADAADDYRDRVARLSAQDWRAACVSAFTRDDLCGKGGFPADRAAVVPNGVDPVFRILPFPTPVDREPYLVFVGGFDPRKNIDGCLRAFARWAASEGADPRLRLRIIGRYDDASRAWFESHARDSGIADRVDLLGFVDEEDLITAYQGAVGAVFPSLYEGFGLPILEALACGCPVLSSRTSSMPEVAGADSVLVDPLDPADIAEGIARVIRLPRDRTHRERRAGFASTFTWDAAAEGVSALCRPRTVATVTQAARRIAWCSPAPPSRSGIADYALPVVLALIETGAQVTWFWEGDAPDPVATAGIPTAPITDLPSRRGDFDECIYHLGNAVVFHREIYRCAWEHPGTVVLHDYVLHPFLQHAFLDAPEWPLYEASLRAGYDDDQVASILRGVAAHGYPDCMRWPASVGICNRSRRVVVHSRYAHRRLAADGCRTLDQTHIIPLPVPVWSGLPSQADARRRLDLPPDALVFACLGFQNRNKAHRMQVEALAELSQRCIGAWLLWAGTMDPAYQRDLLDGLPAALRARIRLAGALSEPDYRAAVVAADVIINLRQPTMGESSASLCDAQAADRPVVVTPDGSYLETTGWGVGSVTHDGALADRLLDAIKLPADVRVRARTFTASLCPAAYAATLLRGLRCGSR
jgi:glycosyltransferase involved in cell wall biosynthesis